MSSIRPVLDRLDQAAEGALLMERMRRLLPMPRSITGHGFRDTQAVLRESLPGLVLEEVPSGEAAFDWTIPDEWNIRAAYVKDPTGRVVVDFADNPLHVVNYSVPISARMPLSDLREHLHSDPGQPDAIPYRTSYYDDAWGFCVPHSLLEGLAEGEYEVFIDSEKASGVLNYGEVVVQGTTEAEFLLTTHACHPGQCNDNLSGVVILQRAAEFIQQIIPRLTFRFLFLPGAIGSVVWLSRNRERLENIVGGLTLSCLGDTAPLRYKETYDGHTEVDKAVSVASRDGGWECLRDPFEPYGFDERNFNSPAFRLAVGSLTRSPHGGFPGYHTSEDNLSSMSPERLAQSLVAVLSVADVMDDNRRFINLVPEAEPQLGKRGLYSSIGGVKERREFEMALLWVMSMSDGQNSLVDIARRSGLRLETLSRAGDSLLEYGLVQEQPPPVAEAGPPRSSTM